MSAPNRLLPRSALCVALLLAAGCASSGPYWSPSDRDVAERSEMKERIADLEQKLTAERDANVALRAELETLRLQVDRSRGAASLSPSSPPSSAASGIETTDDSEPVGARHPRAEIEQSDLSESSELSELNDREGHSSPGGASPAIGEAEISYEQSLEHLEQGRLTEAAAGFTHFLALNADSDLADNAQFWLAESLLRQGDVARALDAFRAVVERYPEGNKVPDALLKVGSCLGSLGDPESAAAVYRELRTRFPESAAAETARHRLENP